MPIDPWKSAAAVALLGAGILVGSKVGSVRHDAAPAAATIAETPSARSPARVLGLSDAQPDEPARIRPADSLISQRPAPAGIDEDPRSSGRATATPEPSTSTDPARRELERRARLVEIEANAELAKLVPLLGLNEAQQDRVFAVLAGTSRHFDPSMAVATDTFAGGAATGATNGSGASPSPSPSIAREEAVHEILDLDQQLAYEEHVADRDAWWSEFLEREESKLDALIDESLASSAATSGAAESSDPALTEPELPEVTQDPAKKNPQDVTAPAGLPSPTLNGRTNAPSGALPF